MRVFVVVRALKTGLLTKQTVDFFFCHCTRTRLNLTSGARLPPITRLRVFVQRIDRTRALPFQAGYRKMFVELLSRSQCTALGQRR